MSAIEEIGLALAEMRYETARRLARAALPGPESERRPVLLLLHRANRVLGDFVACREVLDQITSTTEGEKREVLLLRAGDFRSYANEGHYRTSQEGREGLSVDEFIEKYLRLAAGCQAEADALPRTPLPEPEAPLAPTLLGSTERGSLTGRLTFPNGSPAAHAKVTLGLHLDFVAEDPWSIRPQSLNYKPQVGEVRGLSTITSDDGSYAIRDIPVGHHEFLAVTLDPDQFDIATRFLRQSVEIPGETRIDAVVEDWRSAPPIPQIAPRERIVLECATLSLLDALPMRNPFAFDFPRQVVEWETPHASAPSIALIGPDGEMIPFQRDGGRLLFFAELPGESERTYGLYASEGASAKTFTTPLRLEAGTGTAILHTGRAAFRIPWGESTQPPLLAVRGEDAIWRGCGRWVLPAGLTVQSTVSRLLEEGPVRMRVEVSTTFSNGARYRLILTAHAGEPYLLARETSPEIAGAAFEFSLAEFSGGRSYLHWKPEGGESTSWHTIDRADREIARLQESVPWWIPPAGFGCAFTPDGLEERDFLAVFTIRRGGWIDRKFAAISAGPGNDPAWHRELDWPYPEMVGSTISMITAHSRPDGDAVFRFGLFEGERQWGFLVSDFARNDGPAKEISSIQHKNSSPRLTDFMRWRLDEADTAPRPHVVARRQDLVKIRRKTARPAFAKAWEALRDPEASGPVSGMLFQIENDPLAAWKIKRELLALAPVRSRMTLLGRDAGDLYSPVGGRAITQYAEIYDLLAPSGIFAPHEERCLRAFLMLMGHLYLEPDLMNWHFNSRNANFEADRVDIVGTIGIAFQGNPDADAFVRHAAELMERSLEVYCTPGSGKWYENPACYYLHASKCRLNIAYHLSTHGVMRPTALPRLKDFLTWGILLLTPKHPRSYDLMRDGLTREAYGTAENIRRIAPIGDHAVLGKYILDHAALLAPLYRESDPAFADFLLWAYRETGGFGGLAYGNPALFLSRMEEGDLAVGTPPPDLASRRLEGFGAVFRGNFGTEKEFYLLIKQGPGGYRYHRTEGSLILFADGKPLIYDGGEGGETWRHSTLSFYDTHLPLAAGHVERFASFAALDFCQGVHPCVIRPGDPVFLSDNCHHDLVPLAFERYREPDPANIRTVLWVKDEYVIVQDSLALDPAIPRHWHVQIVADSESGNARDGFVFRGRFGTDLQVLVPGPDVDEEEVETLPLHEYKTAVETRFAMRHLRIRREGADHYAAILRPLAPGATPLRTEISADGNHLQVLGDNLHDDHFFSRQPAEFTFEDGRFHGRYGSVLRRENSVTLCLIEGDTIEVDGFRLRSEGKVWATAAFGPGSARIEAEGDGVISVSKGGWRQTLAIRGRCQEESPLGS